MALDTAALKNQATALGRGGVWFIAGVAVGKGWLEGDSAIMIAGAVLTAISTALSSIANTNSSITSAFAQIPATKKIETTDPKLAEVARQADPATEVKVVKETTT